jgi:hypothetical protein
VTVLKRLLLGVVLALLASSAVMPLSADANFGIKSISAAALEANGAPDLQAGSHPYAYRVNITLNQDSSGEAEGNMRGVIVDLPPGMVGNPQAIPKCSGQDFEGQTVSCPGDTQIGIAEFRLGGGVPGFTPIYNLNPPVGIAARVGFSVTNLNALQDAQLRGSDYGVSIFDQTVPSTARLSFVTETIWGVPADEGHNPQRRCDTSSSGEVSEGGETLGCPTDAPLRPFLTLPTSCTGPLQTTVHIESVENPGVLVSDTVASLNENGVPTGLENCRAEPFVPSFSAQPETNAADSPTGLGVEIGVRQNENPDGLAAAHLRDVNVTLPAGLVINPSAANGLVACPMEGPEGINLPLSADPQVPEPAAVSEPAKCPAASKVGSVEVETPLLDHLVPGTVYLAKQGANPFGSLIALYVALDDPLSGVVVKIAGKVEPDPATGQLRATFANNPQLPFETFKFHFFGGPTGNLTTPSTCGKYQSTAALTPWSAPEGATVQQSSFFGISAGAKGGSCANTEAQLPNAPSFEAGTTQPLAGSYAPLVFKVSRDNGSQRIGSIDTTLPEGLVGKLAGIPYCPDSAIASAAGRGAPGQGAAEQASPSCPLASEVGTVTVGAGSGTPIYVQGHAYLAGPYKGAPLSLEIITPAVAGPFDLGTVAVRTALYVNEYSAQIHAVSDPIPSILQGIPLDVRSIALNMNRPDFTLNPTSCDAMQVLGATTSTLGQVAALQNRFQVGGCKGLEFKPKLSISLKGQTRRAGHPALKAVLTYPKGTGYANISRAQVGLPHSEFLDQGNIGTVCTQAQLRSATCPKRSIYGKAKAWTPLLDKPLEGPVYLGVGFGHKLPDLVAELNGQLRVLVHGKVDTDKQEGIRNTFEAAPDAPVEKFVLEMKGGKKYGLLENSTNICKGTHKAEVRLTAHNGAVDSFKAPIKASCGRHGKKKAPKHGK